MAITLSLFHHHHHPHHQHHNYTCSFHLNPTFKKPIKFQSLPSLTPKSTICHSTSNKTTQQNTQNTPKITTFLTKQELKSLELLNDYAYKCKIPSCGGVLSIRAMSDFEVDMIVELLAESFAESMLLPKMYLKLLGFLVRQYLVERRGLLPHCVTLIGFLSDGETGGFGAEFLVGTVEVSFNRKGANASPPTPTPPKDCPYICNMTVHKEFRRRGIGWHLLKASEELISNMTSSRDVYLHCRLIDTAPFSMYRKAGYEVVKTDSFFILLTLQRRKHLMYKELPIMNKPLEIVVIEDEVVPPLVAESEAESLLFDKAAQNSPDMDN